MLVKQDKSIELTMASEHNKEASPNFFEVAAVIVFIALFYIAALLRIN